MSYPLGQPMNRPAPRPALTPIDGRPNWYTNAAGGEVYVEPTKPSPWAKYIKTLSGGPSAVSKTRSQQMRDAGFTRRPSAKSLPSDE